MTQLMITIIPVVLMKPNSTVPTTDANVGWPTRAATSGAAPDVVRTPAMSS
jgi:hypothetical protein